MISPTRSDPAAGRTGRPPALRLRTDAIVYTVHDLLHGEYTGIVDDFVVRRGDGVAAYNLAVVVDDAAQGIDQVVRGDDLLSSSPRQAYLARLLGYPEPTYAHVALVLNEDGARLAKRDGAVTLAEIGAQQALAQIAESLGWQASNLDEMLAQFDPAKLPRHPWIYTALGRRYATGERPFDARSAAASSSSRNCGCAIAASASPRSWTDGR